MIQKYHILSWDSDFFGFPVAKIIPKKLNFKGLETILRALKKSNVSLVYWASDSADKKSQEAAKSLGGFLTGEKITYTLNLKTLPSISPSLTVRIEKYNEKKPNNDLLDLIVKGGVYSRFYVDPKISKKQYEELHKLWITNSVKDNDIFVIKEEEKIICFISLNEKNNRGNVDFIVIDPAYRRKGLGTALMNHAHNWFASNNYKLVQAETQKENVNACNMYEKLGYKKEKTEKNYHFWL